MNRADTRNEPMSKIGKEIIQGLREALDCAKRHNVGNTYEVELAWSKEIERRVKEVRE